MKHTIQTTIAVLQSHGLPDPSEEFPFAESVGRKWRFDYAWPDACFMVALEIEGVTVQGGRHQQIKGFSADVEKYNAAVLMGWKLIRATPKQIESGQALVWLEKALGVKT